MKLSLKLLALTSLFISGLIQGYAIVHDSGSALPKVDLYLIKAKDLKEGEQKFKNFVAALGYPEATLKILDSVKGISAPIAKVLSGPTDGVSLTIQKGFEIGVSGAKTVYPFLKAQTEDLIGRIWRGSEDAHHWDVFRGNRGRSAEWKTDSTMVMFITLAHSVIPIAPPQLVPPHAIIGFTARAKVNPKTQQIDYFVEFGPQFAGEYISAESDTRKPLKKYEQLAETNGKEAAKLPK